MGRTEISFFGWHRELIPYLKDLTGCKVLVDSDGDVRQLIPLFLEAGVDGMLPFECAAGMDVREIRRDHPGMDHHVPPEVGWEDFLYYLDKVRSLWRQCR